jgi:hypothetical protein
MLVISAIFIIFILAWMRISARAFLAERPSIANPTERANIDEVVNGLVREKLRRKCAVVVGYCDLFGIFIGFIVLLSVNVFSMTYLDNFNNNGVFINLINDSVITNSKSVCTLTTRHLLASYWSRFIT